MLEIQTASASETQKIARILAEELSHAPRGRGAQVIALQGELGAGKTTFVQGFVQALGVKEKVKSPTFVLIKIYSLDQKSRSKNPVYKHLVHIDCYRISSPRDLIHLGLKEILGDKDAIVLIEWADRIRKILPRDTFWIRFTHGSHAHTRMIRFSTI